MVSLPASHASSHCEEFFLSSWTTVARSSEAEEATHRNIIQRSLEFTNFPDDAKKTLKEMWGVDLNAHDRIIIPGFAHFEMHDSDYISCGTCPRMANGHFSSLESGKLITWGDLVIGNLKESGDTSLFALTNVFNEKGELVLVKGGVYQVHRDIVDSWNSVFDLEKASLTQPNVLKFVPMVFMKSPETGDFETGVPLKLRYTDFHGNLFINVIEKVRKTVIQNNLWRNPRLR